MEQLRSAPCSRILLVLALGLMTEAPIRAQSIAYTPSQRAHSATVVVTGVVTSIDQVCELSREEVLNRCRVEVESVVKVGRSARAKRWIFTTGRATGRGRSRARLRCGCRSASGRGSTVSAGGRRASARCCSLTRKASSSRYPDRPSGCLTAGATEIHSWFGGLARVRST